MTQQRKAQRGANLTIQETHSHEIQRQVQGTGQSQKHKRDEAHQVITVTYNVKGADEVVRALDGVRLDALQGDIDRIMDEIANDAAVYPPPTGGKYQRTGDLGRGWTGGETLFPQSSPTLLEAVRENSVSYGPYVQGAEDQAKIHQGRWKTTDQIMSQWEDRVADAVDRAIDRLLPR